VEEEWDQSDLRLANNSQNCRQRLLLESPTDLSSPPKNFPKFKSFFPALILELRGAKLDETWIQGSPQHKEYIPKRVLPKSKDFPFDFRLAQET
jgi:hypothetical protein